MKKAVEGIKTPERQTSASGSRPTIETSFESFRVAGVAFPTANRSSAGHIAAYHERLQRDIALLAQQAKQTGCFAVGCVTLIGIGFYHRSPVQQGTVIGIVFVGIIGVYAVGIVG